MAVYTYSGPVMQFDRCICNKWKATTFAPSSKKAKCNLEYRYKKENGYAPTARITLPGKIFLEE